LQAIFPEFQDLQDFPKFRDLQDFPELQDLQNFPRIAGFTGFPKKTLKKILIFFLKVLTGRGKDVILYSEKK
jgi:hypothetical protein